MNNRFIKDHSIDGWPVKDNETNHILLSNDVLAVLNEQDKEISALKSAKQGWISAEDGLPDHEQRVWVVSKAGYIQDVPWELVGTADCLEWYFEPDDLTLPFSSFTYWALAQPPVFEPKESGDE